jgi:hypothetical protein
VIFERPVTAALLLVLSLTPLLHPRAPRLVDALGVLLVVIPVLRLLPRLLEPALAPAIYALSVFAVLDRVRDVVSKSVLFERSLLLLETIAALAFLAWMLRPARLAALPAGTHISALGATLNAWPRAPPWSPTWPAGHLARCCRGRAHSAYARSCSRQRARGALRCAGCAATPALGVSPPRRGVPWLRRVHAGLRLWGHSPPPSMSTGPSRA